MAVEVGDPGARLRAQGPARHARQGFQLPWRQARRAGLLPAGVQRRVARGSCARCVTSSPTSTAITSSCSRSRWTPPSPTGPGRTPSISNSGCCRISGRQARWPGGTVPSTPNTVSAIRGTFIINNSVVRWKVVDPRPAGARSHRILEGARRARLASRSEEAWGLPCYRCGVRQTDPERGKSPWRRGVLRDELVLVCPACQESGE